MDTTTQHDAAPDQVLSTAVHRLVERGVLDQGQASAVRSEFDELWAGRRPAPETSTRVPLLIEVGGYVGAAFVVAGAAAIAIPTWEDLSQAVRVAVLAVPAVLLLIAALLVTSGTPGGWATRDDGRHGPRRRLVSALLAASGGLIGGVAGVLADGNSTADNLVPAVLLVAWGAGYLACRGSLLHAATAGALCVTVLYNLDQLVSGGWLITGIALCLAAAAWAGLTLAGVIAERTLGLVSAGCLAFLGAEICTLDDQNAACYLLLALLAVVGLGGYLRSRELGALISGGAALAVVVPQAVIDYTDGALGAAGVLLVCGLSVVGASALGMRLRHS